MKVIIAGSRTLEGVGLIEEAVTLSNFAVTTVISGGARGIDFSAVLWARLKSLPIELYPADWATHGKLAGRIRNAQMALKADALIAVWDGYSRGTKHMIDTMKGLEKPTFTLRIPEST